MPLRSLSAVLTGRRWQLVLLTGLSVGTGLAEAAILVIVVRLALAISQQDQAVNLGAGPFGASLSVGALFALGIGLALVRLVLQFATAYLPAGMSTEVLRQLRSSVFERFVHATWSVQSGEREGHLQELLTTQVARVSLAVLLISDAIVAAINFATMLLSAVILEPLAAIGIVASAVTLFLLLRPLARLSRHQSRRRAAEDLKYAASVSEAVRTVEEIQAFGVGGQQWRIVDLRVRSAARYQFRNTFLGEVVPAVYQNVAIGLILSGLGIVYLTGSTEVASLGAVTLILVRALAYSQKAQVIYQKANDLMPYVERVLERRGLYEAERTPSGREPLDHIGEIRFDRVSFAYKPGVRVLKDLSFDLTAGEAVGIVGPSGAGKSTMVQLLLRLREPSHGELLINGRPATHYRLSDWRRLVAFQPQEPKLLSGTVAENIRFLREGISDEEVESAARLAHIHEEVREWPQGYGTVVGHRRDGVSGGQCQRICLARALVMRPQVLVLDEPTSALDVRSESMIQRSLEGSRGKMTIICIAHRLSTLSLCDRIMVLREGELEAFDSAASLLRSNGFYREAVDLSRLS